jgi:CheY-like chemotaxis protein
MSDQASPEEEDASLRGVPSEVLLVEDNFIIALDTEDMLRQLGVKQVWTAVNKLEAFEVIEKRAPAFALLDVNLGEEKGFEVATRLTELGIRFAFGTGYGNQLAFPKEFTGTPVVSKPYRLDALARILSGADGKPKA